MFAFLAERLLSENGVDILYGGMLSKTHKNKQGNKIVKIDVTTRAETLSFTAKVRATQRFARMRAKIPLYRK